MSRKVDIKDLLAPGTVFEGKYRVVQALGAGNFASVFRAVQIGTEREVALKVLRPEVVDSNPDVANRFVAEVNIVSRLHHPNTVTLHDFGRTNSGLYFMVLEYLDGVSLEDVLTQDGALSPQRVIRITQQLLKSLDEAHRQGIVHRDLKPSNIMLVTRNEQADVVKVLDFGVAKLMGDSDDEIESLAQGGRRSTQFVGTPIYMSPEQVLGQKVEPSSDIYSLGLILYQMLTGDSPLDSNLNVSQVAQIHIDEKPIPFKKISDLPRPFAKLIRKATSRYPSDRFQTVRDFAKFLPRQADMEMTGEFQRLVGLGEEEDSVPLVFKGQTYVAPPEEDEEVSDPVSRSRELPKIDVRPQREARKFGSKEELKLDVTRVRREEIDRKRGPTTRESKKVEHTPVTGGQIAWILAGTFGVFVCVHLAGTLIPGGTVVKGALGLLPTALAVVWAHFSEVRAIYGNAMEKWVVPVMRYQLAVLALMLVVMILVMPGYALAALEENAYWFSEAIGGESLNIILDLWVKPLRWILALTNSLLPW